MNLKILYLANVNNPNAVYFGNCIILSSTVCFSFYVACCNNSTIRRKKYRLYS